MVKELSYKRCTVKDSTEYLGNNCVVVSDNDSIEQVTHYYPFGAVYADAGLSPGFQKYKYTGKELDLTHGLNTYDHGARQNYSVLGVWDRVDPMCEKYYNVSPYVVCENNPNIFIDPKGLDIFDRNGSIIEETINDNNIFILDGNNGLRLLSSFNYSSDNVTNINMLKKVASYYLSKSDPNKFEVYVEETGNGIPTAAAFAYSINEDSYYVELNKNRINSFLDDKYNFMSITYHESRHRYVPETRGGTIGEVEAILMQSTQKSWDLATNDFISSQASYAQNSLQKALPSLSNKEIDGYVNRLNEAFNGRASFNYKDGKINFLLTLDEIIVRVKK